MWALACPGVAGAPGRAAADPYADALAEAARLEGAGEVAEAAARLDAAIADYPQDYALILQAGWLHFQSGDYVRAEARYRRAIELSGGSPEARLGLAWARLRQGAREEAEERFAALAAEAPADPRAREGLAAARYRVPVIAAPSASATLQLFPRGDGITAAPGASVGLPFVVRERLLVGVDYNFARFLGGAAGGRAGGMNMNMNMNMDMGMGPGPGPLAPGSPVLGDRYIDRHALYLHAGATWERVGFTGHYGYIHDGGALVGNAHVAGVALRYSPLGDLSLAATGSFYPDQAIPRVALGWAAPATRWLTVTPAFALQVADRQALPSGSLALALHGRAGALWIGGKGGRERRPVYLHVPATFSVDGEIRWGLWGGGSLALPRRLNLFVSYELHRFGDLAGGDLVSAHLLALGLGWRSHAAARP